MKYTLLASMLAIALCNAFCQSRSNNEETARLIFESFNQHDWPKMMSYYAENARFEDPAFEKPVFDRELMTDHHREIARHFPDIRDEVINIYSCGESVIVVEFIAHGAGITGEKIRLPICTVLTFKDGKVIRDATYYDIAK